MSDKVRITTEALSTIDEMMTEWRKTLYSECRSLALQNDRLVDEAVVRKALASMRNSVGQELSHHGERKAG